MTDKELTNIARGQVNPEWDIFFGGDAEPTFPSFGHMESLGQVRIRQFSVFPSFKKGHGDFEAKKAVTVFSDFL